MIDLHLRSESEATLAEACPFLRDDDGWLTSGDGFALDIIGPVVITDGEYDEDFNEITPPVIDSRFHANLRCSAEIAAMVPSELLVHPSSPKRVWA